MAGGLEGVEEEPGALSVEGVLGELVDDLADGVLDGAAVFAAGEGEGGLAAAAGLWVRNGFSGGVVVVAEVFFGEGWAAAAVAVGKEMTAGLAGFLGCDVGHLVPPSTGVFLWVKCETPSGWLGIF